MSQHVEFFHSLILHIFIFEIHLRFSHNYHLRMWVGTVFSHVCLSVCLSVFLPVQAITFEPFDIETSFLVCRYILTISRSSLIKVIGSRSRSYKKKMMILLISTC